MEEQIKQLEKMLSKLNKEALKAPVGSSEQRFLIAAYDKILAKYTDLVKEKNRSDEAISKQNSDNLNKIKENRLKEAELEIKRDDQKLQERISKRNLTGSIIGGTTGIVGGCVKDALSIAAYNGMLNKVITYESTGIIKSTATKSVLTLLKPKI